MLKIVKPQTIRQKLGDIIKKRHEPIWVAGMVALMLLFVSTTAYRIHSEYAPPPTDNEFNWENRGHSDFHNGSYFPALCYMQGDCPYSSDDASNYLMPRAAATYSPIVFVLHVPFAILPLELADVAFFVCNVAMLMLIAYFSIQMSGATLR